MFYRKLHNLMTGSQRAHVLQQCKDCARMWEKSPHKYNSNSRTGLSDLSNPRSAEKETCVRGKHGLIMIPFHTLINNADMTLFERLSKPFCPDAKSS